MQVKTRHNWLLAEYQVPSKMESKGEELKYAESKLGAKAGTETRNQIVKGLASLSLSAPFPSHSLANADIVR
jgi:hypothetical protein